MTAPPKFDRPIAHRGLHTQASGIIENSASAFAAALAENYAIECDLQLSSDGLPVVFHDDDLLRLTGRVGAIRDLTAAQIQELILLGSATADHPLLFSEFLAQINGRVLIQIELKRQTGPATGMLAKMTAGALAGYAGPVTVESFDPALIILMRKFGFRGPVGIITELYTDHDSEHAFLSRAQRFFLRHLLHMPFSRFDFISCDQRALNLPMVRFWRALGRPVTTWTIRSEQEAAAVADHADQIVFEGFAPNRATK